MVVATRGRVRAQGLVRDRAARVLAVRVLAVREEAPVGPAAAPADREVRAEAAVRAAPVVQVAPVALAAQVGPADRVPVQPATDAGYAIRR